MITQIHGETDTESCWILQPTRSMTWPAARRFIFVLCAIGLVIGGTFAYFGMPFVLVFVILELLAIALTFYLVLLAGERREVIRLDDSRVCIETGRRSLEHRVELERAWTRAKLIESGNRCHPARLTIACGRRAIELGRFLTERERRSFAKTLNAALRNAVTSIGDQQLVGFSPSGTPDQYI